MKFRALVIVAAALSLVPFVAQAKSKQEKQAQASTSTSTTSTPDPKDILAWVDGQPITRQELESRLDDLSPAYRQQFQTPEGRQKLLDGIIEEHVWMSAAVKAGVPARPEVAHQIESTTHNLVIRTYLGDMMQGTPSPSDSAVQAYYDAHKTDPMFTTAETRRARHIQVATQAEAKEVMRRIKAGADFATLAKQLSKDATTKQVGGEMGPIDRNGMIGAIGRQPAIADSVFAAKGKGSLTGPVKTSLGWHVVQVEEIIPASSVSLEDAKPRIVPLLSRQMQEDYYKAQLAKAKESESFRYNQAVVDSFLHGQKSSADLFRDAQDATTSDERIAGYQRVVDQYPQSEQAPQAEFMVGFVYSEEKKDYDRAEAAFKKLLADYPKSELSHSAQWMLDNMRTDALPNFDLPNGVKRSANPGSNVETPPTATKPSPAKPNSGK
jgi:peptidyl-prolyl cis-trans isomerase C